MVSVAILPRKKKKKVTLFGTGGKRVESLFLILLDSKPFSFPFKLFKFRGFCIAKEKCSAESSNPCD